VRSVAQELSLKSEERIETLTGLGLTVDEARIYLALLQTGTATAKQLAENSKIVRPDIYRIIPTLQKKGIIEILITRPTRFQAIPVARALPFLLKRKTTEQNELKKKTQELLSDLKNNHAEKDPQETDTEFAIIYGEDAIMQRLKEALLKAKIRVCAVTSQKRFSEAILELAKGYQKALKKGVKIRIAAEKHVTNKAAFKIVQTLSQNPNFEVRYFSAPSPEIVTIFDSREAYVTMSQVAQLAEASAIWSNNHTFITLAQTYFENKWNNSTSE
jgi:sugar-specific transcriptional regulator TrmB